MKEDIIIRNAVEQDASELLEIYSYYVKNTAITFEYDVPTLGEFRGRIDRIQTKYPYLIAERAGEVLGYAYAGAFHERAAYDWSAEVTIYLRKDAVKCGLGKRLYEALEQALRQMGITNLYACIGYPEKEDEYLNRNSAQFHEHLGYQTVGLFKKCGYKFNRWYHMIWMEKIIGSHQDKQPSIIKYTEIFDKRREQQ